MKRVTQNPFPVVELMLDRCRKDNVDFDAFAAEHAVHIADGTNPIAQAGVFGLVYSHNLQSANQTSAAAAAFIQARAAGFLFEPNPGDNT